MLRYTVYSGEVNGDRTPIARYAGRTAAVLAALRIREAGQPAFITDGSDVIVRPEHLTFHATGIARLETEAAAEYLRLVVAQVQELLDVALNEDEQLARAAEAVTFDHGIASLIDQRRRMEANGILGRLIRFHPTLVEDLTVDQASGSAVAD